MSRHPDVNEDATLRAGFGLLAFLLLASGVLTFDLAREHMAVLAAFCGGAEHPHCGWCYATAGFALTGIAALAAALRPASPALRQIKAKLRRTCD